MNSLRGSFLVANRRLVNQYQQFRTSDIVVNTSNVRIGIVEGSKHSSQYGNLILMRYLDGRLGEAALRMVRHATTEEINAYNQRKAMLESGAT